MHFQQVILSKFCNSPHREQQLLISGSNAHSIFRLSDRQQESRYHQRVVSFLLIAVLIQRWKTKKGKAWRCKALPSWHCVISDRGHAAANVRYALNFPWYIPSVESADAALLKRLFKHMEIKPKYCLTDLWELMLRRDDQKALSTHGQEQRCDT